MGATDGNDGLVGIEEQCDAANVVGCDDVKPPVIDVPALMAKAKFYTSLCMGTTAIVSVFAFLFLIPFVVDPAISTIVADYDQEPVTCRGTEHIYSEGLTNCTWASCREGCTSAVLKCHQIWVNYSLTPFKEFELTRDIDALEWAINNTRFFINTEGCGYPPRVNCSEFAKTYGYHNVGIPFPCYYSRTYPEMVVAMYSWDSNLRHLLLSLFVPNFLFLFSIGVLTYWYCPGCQRGCSQQQPYVDSYPSKQESPTKKKKKSKEGEETKEEEEVVVPQQNKGLIMGIFICQFMIVLSIVSFIYLSVAIYKPSYYAFNSGFEPQPVICHTLQLNLTNNCSWASCGEWCLTKTSGFCPQIYVTVRQNATDMILENCTRISTNSCPPVNYETFKKINCNNGSECGKLTGLFNCSKGHCANMSQQLLCHYKADGPVIDAEVDNIKLNGFFECKKSQCTKIRRPFSCDRNFCPRITTTGVNAFLMYEDAVYTGDCARALASNVANGTGLGYKVSPTEIWTEQSKGGYLLAACRKVVRVGNTTTLNATDCINGTVLAEADMPTPFVNFTTFWSVFDKSSQPLDPEARFLPDQRNLTIYGRTKLFINLDGCVNTLRGECKEFTATYGREGLNRTAISVFPCYYNKNDSSKVIVNFDLEKTRRELVVALAVPSILFAISFTALMVVSRAVRVGDDSVLRCALCVRENKTTDEKIALQRTDSRERLYSSSKDDEKEVLQLHE